MTPGKKQTIDLMLAILAAGFFATAVVLNVYRYQLFGVVHHNAANNFWFNLTFFIPLMLLSAALCILVNLRLFFGWNERTNLVKKMISLALTAPVLLIFLKSLVQIFLMNFN